MKTDLAERIERLITEARKRTVAAVNTAMVYTYYEIGRMIVDDEQKGTTYASYGKETLKNVSMYLIARFGKGYSVDNLERNVAFRSTSIGHGRQLWRYALSVAGAIAINYFSMKLLVEACDVWPTPAKMLTTVLSSIYSFLAAKFFTFREEKA